MDCGLSGGDGIIENKVALIMEELSSLPICRLEKGIHMVHCCSKEINSLPDELLQTIFSLIPTACLVVATVVCKRWHRIIYSGLLHTNIVPQKPWYFMCSWPNAYEGHIFDSALGKWYHFTLPNFVLLGSFLASSCGLLSFRHNDETNKICLFNPITSDWKLLPEAPFISFSRCQIALSVDRNSRDYMLSVIQCQFKPMEAPHGITLSIHLFESATESWSTLHSEVINGRVVCTSNSVVCAGSLYCIVEIQRSADKYRRYVDRLITYDLSDRSSRSSCISTIAAPLPILDGNLMSHCGRLFLAGIVLEYGNDSDGIRIWELENGSWRELSRMPREFIDWDDADIELITICSANGLVFVQIFQSTPLYMFDVIMQLWRSFEDSPVNPGVLENMSDREIIYKSFCFEPRLDMRT